MDLIPRREPQEISYQDYQEYTPEKLEMYENNVFFDEQERLNMLKLLMANVGIETLVKNLPTETRKELTEVLEEIEMTQRCIEIVEKEVLKFGKLKVDHEYKFDKKNNHLYIFFRVIDTGSIWSVLYKYYKEIGEFEEEGRFQAFACEDTVRKLLDR